MRDEVRAAWPGSFIPHPSSLLFDSFTVFAENIRPTRIVLFLLNESLRCDVQQTNPKTAKSVVPTLGYKVKSVSLFYPRIRHTRPHNRQPVVSRWEILCFLHRSNPLSRFLGDEN